jgi:hypothetical protein
MIDWKTLWAYIANREPEPKELVYCSECKRCEPLDVKYCEEYRYSVSSCKATPRTVPPTREAFTFRSPPYTYFAPCVDVNPDGRCKKYEPL